MSRDFNSLKEQRIRSNYSQLLCTSLTDCNFVSAVQIFGPDYAVRIKLHLTKELFGVFCDQQL